MAASESHGVNAQRGGRGDAEEEEQCQSSRANAAPANRESDHDHKQKGGADQMRLLRWGTMRVDQMLRGGKGCAGISKDRGGWVGGWGGVGWGGGVGGTFECQCESDARDRPEDERPAADSIRVAGEEAEPGQLHCGNGDREPDHLARV